MSNNFNIRDFLLTEDMTEEEIDRCEFWTTANRLVRESGKHNFEEVKIQVNNEWDLNKLEIWLEGYHDKEIIKYLKYGWPLNAVDTAVNTEVPANQKGARQNPSKIRSYLKKELEAGSIIGPFKRNPFGKYARFSPLDTRPKKHSEDLRVILNLSFPHGGESVNKSISKNNYVCNEDMTVRYPSVDDLARIVRRKGKRCRIFVRDLSRAYRQLWMCPGSVMMLGYSYDDVMFFDVCLSMGSKSAAYCCQRTTNCITYIFNKHGFEDVNYLDDLGAAEEESRAEEAFDCLGWILDTIGIQEAKQKASPPAYIAVFLGILYNTIDMTLRITPERLLEIKLILDQWAAKSTTDLHDLQSLLGKLNFAASTIRAGRIFVSRLLNLLRNFPEKGRRKIDKETKKDIDWWRSFMEDFDGISIIPPIGWDAPDTVFSSDACLVSGGGWCEQSLEAFHVKFPKWLTKRDDVHINELELLTVIVALKLWSSTIRNRNILAYCDNEVSVEVVNSGRARNRFSQACLREICFISARNNAWIKLVHVSSENNRISDCLSRWENKQKRDVFRDITRGKNVKFCNVDHKLFEFSNDW